MQLTITVREKQGVTILELNGRVVAGEECDTLRKKIKELQAAGPTKTLLNLADVVRLDSTGIGMLVESVINAAKQGGQFKLFNVPRLLRSILSTHRLLQAFEVFDNEDDALRSFAQPAQQVAS